MNRRVLRHVPACGLLLLLGCGEDGGGNPPDDSPLTVGDAREVELRYVRFDVTNFEKRLDRNAILALPHDIRERLWLFDLDLSSGPNTPQLLDNALAAIRELDPSTLGPAERNMQALLRMTPDSANLQGTSIESLINLAPLLGVASEQVLADLFKLDVESAFLSNAQVAETILSQVIRTHPNAQTRLGPVSADNPQGRYPVAAGTLPVNLTDLVTNFASFSRRFGPWNEHPGFVGSCEASVLTEDFAISVRANANALPYRGVDLGTASVASVSSIRSQIDDLFDFEDPNWMRVEGLVEGEPSIASMAFRIVEAPEFVKGGISPIPEGLGSSPAWLLPEWTLERVLIGAAQTAFAGLNSQVSYAAPGATEPLFSAKVEEGFQTITVQGGIGSPPQSSYVWDLLLEVGQVRLHDEGLGEGEANVEFTLHDVPIGTSTSELEERVKANLRADPGSLLALTEHVLASTEGEADFYYYQASADDPTSLQGDWLLFVVEGDIAADDEGNPVRAYSYAHPGFYRDAALTEKLSSTEALDGDTEHEKVRLEEGSVLYAEDETGAVFRLTPQAKPSTNRISLLIERVR